MDFFEHQETARKSSRRLVTLFVIAVLLIVIAVNVVTALVYQTFVAPGTTAPAGLFVVGTLMVLALIGGGTAVELNALRAGGHVVARMVGAREVDPSTRDLLDRRFLNVVEEMSIASGVPVPRVFVMDDQSSINAFAAGHSINDAVIAVTRGTLTRLSRAELQGVVAHEFSHVLNGDMRLNMRLVGVLFGLMIVAIAGRFMLEVGGRGRSSSGRAGGALAAIVIAGIAMWLLGYIGVFFGRLIKAAVSRQREFLADASAVQFTRDPDGIGGALRKIGGLSQQTGLGSRIDHPQAETLSHMFLGAPRPSLMGGFLSTHPPIAERLKRIYGRSVEMLPAPENALQAAGDAAPSSTSPAASLGDAGEAPPSHATASAGGANLVPLAALIGAGAVAGERVASAVGTVDAAALADSERVDPAFTDLHDAANDGTHAPMLVLALLVDAGSDVQSQQSRLIAESYGTQAWQKVHDLQRRAHRLTSDDRAALLDVAMPALRKLAADDRARLIKTAHLLVVADGRVTVSEFLLFTIVRRRLSADAGEAVPVRYRSAAELPTETSLVLSLIAALRLPTRAEHAFNAGALLMPGVDMKQVPAAQIRLDAVAEALTRLNQLAPLAKPQLIKAATATAFVDGSTQPDSAGALRMVCAALDAPLPPRIASA